MTEQQNVETVARLIKKAEKIVAFTGAGISTASGIPDFRSSGGGFDRLHNRHYSGEEALSRPFFDQHPALFFENFQQTLYFPDAVPNFSHHFFHKLEEMGKEVTIVTQNIDNLHELAGSARVLTLHGNATRWLTAETKRPVPYEVIRLNEAGIALAPNGERVRPDIVLYGEQLDEKVITAALRAIAEADLLLVVGTSLLVSPANTFIDVFRGDNAVLINRTSVPLMERFQLVIRQESEAFFKQVWQQLIKEETD